MNDATPDSDRLIDEAIDLVIRLQNDPDNPVALEMIRTWRARGPEHEQVWTQVADVRGMTGKILTDRHKAERRRSPGLTRRNLIVGGVLGLGAVSAGSYILPDMILEARADHLTAKGEIRRVDLADAITATLGPDSAIALGQDRDVRRVELLKGMAFFEVEENPRRPFLVESGDLVATSFGARCDISNDAGIVSVSVDRGVLETRAPGSALSAGKKLEAGDWLAFDRSSQSIDSGKREGGQIGAWRDKMIVAEREPIAALVAKAGRWIPGRIVIANPFIGAQKVSGLFDLTNPLRALEAIVLPGGGRVRQVSSYLTLISPI